MSSKLLLIFFSLLMFCGIWCRAQSNTTVQTNSDYQASKLLLKDLKKKENGRQTAALLPSKMVFTQRWLWGKRGLMRRFKAFKLSKKERIRELKIRRKMLRLHQIVGLATLGGMIAQVFLGLDIYNGERPELVPIHKVLGVAVATGYFSTAAMSLFAPPKMINRPKGITSIKVHEGLAIIHFSAMISVLALTHGIEKNNKLKYWHRAAGLTLFGSYAAAVISITFK